MQLSCSCSLLVNFVLTYLAESIREVLLISCSVISLGVSDSVRTYF